MDRVIKAGKVGKRRIPHFLMGLLGFFLLPGLLMLPSGCASGQGALFEESSGGGAKEPSGEKAAEGEGQESDGPLEPGLEEGELAIDSSPRGARVSIDGKDRGKTPLRLEGMESGSYRVRLTKTGYETLEDWISLGDKGTAIHYDLEELTGILRVFLPQSGDGRGDFEVLVDGIRRSRLESGRDAELPVGEHTVRVRCFGFQEAVYRVTVREDEVTRLQAELEQAPFSLQHFTLSREVFNPENPGLLGRVRLSFRASAAGSATVRVADPAGNTAAVYQFPSFTTWYQSWHWDGRDEQGNPLPPGVYTLEVSGRPAGGGGSGAGEASREDELVWKGTLEIDPALKVRLRNLHSGSGLLFAPTADTLPPGYFQMSLGGMGHVQPDSGRDGRFRGPALLGFRFGLGDRTEMVLAPAAVLDSEPALSSLGGRVTVKQRLAGGGTAPAALTGYVRGGWQGYAESFWEGPDYASFGVFTGGALGLTAEGAAGPVHGTVSWESGAAGTEPLLRHRIRGGIFWDTGRSMTGISVSAPVKAGGWVPLQAGAEGHWMVPGTPLFLSLTAGLHWENPESWFAEGGGGCSVLF